AALPPLLFEGDHLDAAEFLRRWEALPDLKYAELIDGVVFMGSPLSLDHGTTHYEMTGWLCMYSSRTPGCRGGDDTTWVMGAKAVPQPDIFLRILPEYGGQSGETAGGKYGAGAPELIVEVTGSSRSRDFGAKKELYRSVGVREYLTVDLSTRTITWRQLVRGRYRDLEPGEDGVLRSRVFPGLWLHPPALWKGKLVAAAEKGLRSPEHAEFVKRLASATGRASSSQTSGKRTRR
ncbi:MAG: Uma2 family endonuclease, partial [Bryobacterales bacterium]|nr:Uma2 family endonuclease [Bryobacterales bacterium]